MGAWRQPLPHREEKIILRVHPRYKRIYQIPEAKNNHDVYYIIILCMCMYVYVLNDVIPIPFFCPVMCTFLVLFYWLLMR